MTAHPQYMPGLVRTCGHSLLWVAFFSVFLNLLMLASPLYLMNVYDRVLPSNSQQTLLALTAVVLGCFAIFGILDWVRQRILARIGARYAQILGPDLADHSVRSNDSRPLGDLEQIRTILTSPVAGALFDLPLVPIYLIFTAIIHPLLGAISLGGALCMLLLAITARLLSDGPTEQAQKAVLSARQKIDHARYLGDALQVLGMQDAVRRRWQEEADIAANELDKASGRASFFASFVKLFRMLLQVGLIGTGAWLVLNENISAGAIFAISIISSRGLQPIEALVGGWRQLNLSRAAYQRLKQVPKPATRQSLALPPPTGLVKFEDVSLMIEGDNQPLLANMNFTIQPGELVAIIGPSGAGKSTLARLLVGAISPTSGTIRLSGTDIAHWPQETLGQYLGYLAQDCIFTQSSVSEAISRLQSNMPSENVLDAAQLAHVHQAIQRFPQGYETIIGPGSNALSGGQKQQVALARAFFGDPPLMILDEPNAHLDAQGEQNLNQALIDARERGRTTFVISQRAGILPLADRVLMVRDRSVREVTEQVSKSQTNAKPFVDISKRESA
jgi:ATP-binding cassette subfamily C protein